MFLDHIRAASYGNAGWWRMSSLANSTSCVSVWNADGSLASGPTYVPRRVRPLGEACDAPPCVVRLTHSVYSTRMRWQQMYSVQHPPVRVSYHRSTSLLLHSLTPLLFSELLLFGSLLLLLLQLLVRHFPFLLPCQSHLRIATGQRCPGSISRALCGPTQASADRVFVSHTTCTNSRHCGGTYVDD